MPTLAGRVVAITGASAGIGRATALQLAAAFELREEISEVAVRHTGDCNEG